MDNSPNYPKVPPPAKLSHYTVIQCHNLKLVMAINKGSCKDQLVMQLLRNLKFFVTHFDMNITSTHIAETLRSSIRVDMSYFFCLNSQATRPQHHYPNHSYYYYQLLSHTGHLHSSRSCLPIPLVMVHITSSTKELIPQEYNTTYIGFCTQTQCQSITTSMNTLLLFVA